MLPPPPLILSQLCEGPWSAFPSPIMKLVMALYTNYHQIRRVVLSTMSSPDNVVYFQQIVRIPATPTTKPAKKLIPFKNEPPEVFW